MKAYTGTMTKEATLAQLQAHYDHDEIVQGFYWRDGKGCAVGCLTHRDGGHHELFPEMFAMPESFARLIDRIFEGLSPAEAKEWPLRIMSAIPEGADVELVMDRFLLWTLRDLEPIAGTSLGVVRHMADLYERRINGDEPRYEEWITAVDAAEAAWAAAWDAGDAGDAEAAWSAAAAAGAARAAAWAAARAAAGAVQNAAEAAWDASEQSYFLRASDELVRLAKDSARGDA